MISYWNSANGAICSNDVIGLYGILRGIGRVDRQSFFIKSDDGFGQASLRMVNLLRQLAGELTVLVPLECASAVTMLALGADKILIGPLAHLSAVDTSLTHDLSLIDRDNNRVRLSQDELHRVVWCGGTRTATSPSIPISRSSVTSIRWSSERSTGASTALDRAVHRYPLISYHMQDAGKAAEI
jgi:hypothetical protein